MPAMQRIVMPPPGTTTIVVPGEIEYTIRTAPLFSYFSIDSNTLLAGSPYQGLGNVYRSYRVRRVSIRISVPSASTASTGYFVSTLQYVQPGVQTPTPVQPGTLLSLRPNKETRPWVHHNWVWLPSTPTHFDFNLITNQVDFATCYFSLGATSIVPNPNNAIFLVRYIAEIEFQGLPSVLRSVNVVNRESEDNVDDDFVNLSVRSQ